MKRSISYACFLLCLLIALCVMPTIAAAESPDVWVTSTTPHPAADGQDAIHWWYSQKEHSYMLFLPSCTTGEVQLHYTGLKEPTLDGEPLLDGQTISVSNGKEMLIEARGSKYKLTIMCSQNVATMFIQTESGSLDYIHKRKTNEETGYMVMVDADGQTVYDGELTQMRGRGNATFQLPKKSYQIKLESKADLIGAGEHKTWLLMANHKDNSLLRNKIAFLMADAVGLSYTSQSSYCDLYVNYQYVGSYLICEKVQVGNNRIEIADLDKQTESLNDLALSEYARFGNRKYKIGTRKGSKIPVDPDDITGGYLLELEYETRYSNEASGFVTKWGQAVVVKEPEYASYAQMEYIVSFIQAFENAVRSSDGVNDATGLRYTDYIDLDSVVMKYMIEEISKNFDGNKSSQYFYKPADSQSPLLYGGPVWDYDSSFGNRYEGSPKAGTGNYFMICNSQLQQYYWYPALYKHEDFRKRVQELYVERFQPILEALTGRGEAVNGVKSIAEYGEELTSTAAMNFVRWPVFNIKSRQVKTGANYQENLDFLTNFISVRLDFLNEQWAVPYANGEVCGLP